MSNTLELIIPFFNPAPDWAEVLLDNYKLVSSTLLHERIGVILVNDGSTESIAEDKVKMLEAELPSFKFVSYAKNKGKGHALRKGVFEAKAPKIIYTDFDFPYTLESLVNMADKLSTYDVVIGVRSEAYYDNIPDKRKKLSLRLKKLNKMLTGLPITDTQAGLKGFNRKGKKVFMQTKIKRFLFDLEFVDLAFHDNRISVTSLPIELKENIEFTKFNKTVLLKELKNFILLLGKMNVRRVTKIFTSNAKS